MQTGTNTAAPEITQKRTYQKHKTEKKIRVEHFVFKKGKFVVSEQTGEPLYPVFIQIATRNQITTVKSRANVFTNDKLLEADLKRSEYIEFIENEKAIIERTLREANYDTNPDFKLTDWSDWYREAIARTVDDWVNSRTKTEVLKQLYESKILNSKQFSVFTTLNANQIYYVLQAFQPDFLNSISTYDYKNSLPNFESVNEWYNRLHNTNIKFSIMDATTNYYQKVLATYFKNPNHPAIQKLDKFLQKILE